MNAKDSKPVQMILASSSSYRRALLQRLGLDFSCHAPEIDETAMIDETVEQTTERLAIGKARAIQAIFPAAMIIASDQLCSVNGRALGKPGTRARAIEQLETLSGGIAHFQTAVCVLHDEKVLRGADCTQVHFRTLARADIERYLDREPALDCAGSFKSEGLGISLCEAIETRDPSALIGLPLILTASLLRRCGVALP